MKSPQTKPVRLLQEKYQENLEGMLKSLLKDEVLSDITIHCRDGVVRAHRVILAASSPYFKKVFQEHPEQQVAFLLHGVGVKQIKSLVELMYRGSTQIPSDMIGALCEIAEDFGIKGIVDENDKYLLNAPGRDTRFKGQKRVAVDFETNSVDNRSESTNFRSGKNEGEKKTSALPEKLIRKAPENAAILLSPTPHNPALNCPDSTALPAKPEKHPLNVPNFSISSTALSAEARRRSSWALKQRKYKCTLCSASFKRASHLSRHQLVHTGERPFACEQCDKAFSRHDKLKHHIRKTHSMEYVENVPDTVTEERGVYTIGHVKMDIPHSETLEEPTRITREDLLAHMPIVQRSEPHSVPEKPAEIGTAPPIPIDNPVQKKGRGRPRKYPPVAVLGPLIKRPRGRPRLNQPARPDAKSPEPNKKDKSSESNAQEKSTDQHRENYDITNMPFGDLEYLTKSLNMETNSEGFDETNSSDRPYIEPLVQIELDQSSSKKLREDANEEEQTVLHHHTAGAFLQNIGLLENSAVSKMEIGECTISVSKSP